MGCDEVDESVRGYSVKEVGSSDNECRYGLQSGGRPETALIYTLVIACPDFGNRSMSTAPILVIACPDFASQTHPGPKTAWTLMSRY